MRKCLHAAVVADPLKINKLMNQIGNKEAVEYVDALQWVMFRGICDPGPQNPIIRVNLFF